MRTRRSAPGRPTADAKTGTRRQIRRDAPAPVIGTGTARQEDRTTAVLGAAPPAASTAAPRKRREPRRRFATISGSPAKAPVEAAAEQRYAPRQRTRSTEAQRPGAESTPPAATRDVLAAGIRWTAGIPSGPPSPILGGSVAANSIPDGAEGNKRPNILSALRCSGGWLDFLLSAL